MKRCSGFRALWLALVLAQLGMLGCGTDNAESGKRATLRGRVYSADSARGLSGATVVVKEADGATKVEVQTGEKGRFELDYKAAPGQRIAVSSAHHATIYEAAPESGGYVDLFATAIEVDKRIDLSKEAQLVTPRGLVVTVKPGSLMHGDGTPAKKVDIQVARSDLRKTSELIALPGDFDVEVDGKRGKMLLKDALYVNATEGGKPLKGQIQVGFLEDNQKAAKDSSDLQLWNSGQPLETFIFEPLTRLLAPNFLESPQDAWLSQGHSFNVEQFGLTPAFNPDGSVFYTGGVSIDVNGPTNVGFGMATTLLGCVRACVKDEAGKPVAAAQLTASLPFPAFSGSRNTDAMGCVAVELPKLGSLPLSVRVAGDEGAWQGEVILEPTGSIEDPASCQALPDIMLQKAADSGACPSGYLECGDRCLDPSLGDDCDGVDEGGQDAGSDAGVDAGEPALDGGDEQPMMDAGTGSDATLPEEDAAVPEQDGGIDDAGEPGEGDAGSDGGADSRPVFYVNVETGQDDNPGTELAPKKTITQALAALPAGQGARIFVAPGLYSTGNGETFPLIVPANVDLARLPEAQGTVQISGGGAYTDTHSPESIIAAVVLTDNAVLSGITVTSDSAANAYAVAIDGPATAKNAEFRGQHGVRIFWHNPTIEDSRFEVAGMGVNGCMGGLIQRSTFVGGTTQVKVWGFDLCLLWYNTFEQAGDVGLLVTADGAAWLEDSTFVDEEGYSLAAVYVEDDGRVELRRNDFTALRGGTIVQTGLDQNGLLVDLGTVERPGNNKFPGDEPTPFTGVRLQHDANCDVEAYGNDWGDGQTSPVCDVDVRRSGSASQGYAVNAENVCSW